MAPPAEEWNDFVQALDFAGRRFVQWRSEGAISKQALELFSPFFKIYRVGGQRRRAARQYESRPGQLPPRRQLAQRHAA
jgi:hypothetical protein